MSNTGSPRRPHLLRTTPRRDLAGWQLDIKPDPKIGRAILNQPTRSPNDTGKPASFCLQVTIRAIGCPLIAAADHDE